MQKINTFTEQLPNYPSELGNYYVEILKNGVFAIGYHFENYSGTAVHDEIKQLKKQYPAEAGYKIVW